MMHLRMKLIFAIIGVSAVAMAQNPVTVDSPFQVRYAANLNVGDSVINITNSGASGAGLASGTSAATTGAICANVYTFSPDEQLISCCSCPVTPNGLVSLSARNDLINNTLTPSTPTSIVIKLLASVPVAGSCNNSAANVGVGGAESSGGALVSGMLAWGTTTHLTPGPTTGTPYATEGPFRPATLSAGELNRLTSLCTFIIANGSTFGICRACRPGGGGLAADKL
jgi:hypothetical protein